MQKFKNLRFPRSEVTDRRKIAAKAQEYHDLKKEGLFQYNSQVILPNLGQKMGFVAFIHNL